MALVMLGQVGCSQPTTPKSPPSSTEQVESTTPTPTTTPKPSPPVVAATPGESETRTLVRQYLALGDFARRTGDTAPFLALAAKDCDSCVGASEVVKGIYGAGGHYEGDYVQQIKALEGNGSQILAVIHEGDSRRIIPGKPTQSLKAREYSLTFRLKREGNRWVVARIASGT